MDSVNDLIHFNGFSLQPPDVRGGIIAHCTHHPVARTGQYMVVSLMMIAGGWAIFYALELSAGETLRHLPWVHFEYIGISSYRQPGSCFCLAVHGKKWIGLTPGISYLSGSYPFSRWAWL